MYEEYVLKIMSRYVKQFTIWSLLEQFFDYTNFIIKTF